MRFLWVFSGKKIKQYIVVLTAFLFTIGIVYSEKENIPIFSSQDNHTKAIYSVKTTQKQVALTFDISWGEKRPGEIVDILNENNLNGKVTFFLSSIWSAEHPEIVKEIVDGGYEIGSHGHKHINYTKLPNEDIENQILESERILFDLTGEKPNLIRTPNGDIDSRVLKVTDSIGYTVIQWDTDPKDWMNPGVDEIVDRVMEGVHPGDIILLHASDSSKQTHEALPIIIKKLKDQGYEFVTVSELISNAEIESKEID